LHYHIN